VDQPPLIKGKKHYFTIWVDITSYTWKHHYNYTADFIEYCKIINLKIHMYIQWHSQGQARTGTYLPNFECLQYISRE